MEPCHLHCHNPRRRFRHRLQSERHRSPGRHPAAVLVVGGCCPASTALRTLGLSGALIPLSSVTGDTPEAEDASVTLPVTLQLLRTSSAMRTPQAPEPAPHHDTPGASAVPPLKGGHYSAAGVGGLSRMFHCGACRASRPPAPVRVRWPPKTMAPDTEMRRRGGGDLPTPPHPAEGLPTFLHGAAPAVGVQDPTKIPASSRSPRPPKMTGRSRECSV